MDSDTWFIIHWVAVVVALVGSFALGIACYGWIIDVLRRHIPHAGRFACRVFGCSGASRRI